MTRNGIALCVMALMTVLMALVNRHTLHVWGMLGFIAVAAFVALCGIYGQQIDRVLLGEDFDDV
jgi:amino acid permease